MPKTKIKKTSSAHLTVEGDYVMNLCRQVWVEMDPEKAIRMMVGSFMGMTEEQAIEILTGKYCLVGRDSKVSMVKDENPKEIYGMPLLSFEEMLEKVKKTRVKDQGDLKEIALNYFKEFKGKKYTDEIIESLQYSYLKPSRRSSFREKLKAEQKVANVVRRHLDKVVQQYLDTHDEEDGLKQERLSKKKKSKVERDEERMDMTEDIVESLNLDSRNKFFMSKFVKNIGKEIEIFEDPKMESRYGWLSPQGVFYKCDYGQHVQLSMLLENNEVNSERYLEKGGWIKVSHGDDGLVSRGFDFHIEEDYDFTNPNYRSLKPTHKQLDAMLIWCSVHKRKMPEWATGEFNDK